MNGNGINEHAIRSHTSKSPTQQHEDENKRRICKWQCVIKKILRQVKIVFCLPPIFFGVRWLFFLFIQWAHNCRRRCCSCNAVSLRAILTSDLKLCALVLWCKRNFDQHFRHIRNATNGFCCQLACKWENSKKWKFCSKLQKGKIEKSMKKLTHEQRNYL